MQDMVKSEDSSPWTERHQVDRPAQALTKTLLPLRRQLPALFQHLLLDFVFRSFYLSLVSTRR